MNIEGVTLTSLQTHFDDRGSLTEIYRDAWHAERPVQWNYVRSKRNVLRGVHGHFRHTDLLILLQGKAVIGLHDLRADSATAEQAAVVELSGECLRTLTIPPGVAHGFFFPEPSIMAYAVTHYWAGDDELGCRWDDPALRIPWPFHAANGSPDLSPRDAVLPGYPEFRDAILRNLAAI